MTPSADEARNKWALFAVLLAVLAAGSLVVVLLGGGDAGGEGELTVERVPGEGGAEELVVSVPEAVNTPKVARGRGSVGLRCRDGAQRVVLETQLRWPFVENEAGFEQPHQHQPLRPEHLDTIRECRLTGTTVELSGKLEARG